MQFLTVYFSGTGNTWWLMEQVVRLVKTAGHSIINYSIEMITPELWPKIQKEWDQADRIGFAHPIYGSNTPKIMREFVENLPSTIDLTQMERKPAFVFTTMELFSGDGALRMKKILQNTKLDLQVAYNFQMVSNLGIPLFTYNPCNDAKFEKRRQKTLQKLEKTVSQVIAGDHALQNRFNPIGYFFGWLQRIFMSPLEKRNWKYLGVNSTRCTECLQCVNHCPEGAIHYQEGQFSFDTRCTACYRCYNYCPSKAITVGGRSMKPRRHRQHRTYYGKPFY